MKRCRALLILLFLLLLVGIPTGFFARAVHQAQLNHAFITAIKRYDTPAALASLKAGADVNARDDGDAPPSLLAIVQRLCAKLVSHQAAPTVEDHDTALCLLFRQYLSVDDLAGLTDPADNPHSLVSILIQQGADCNTPGSDQETPLMMAVSLGFSTSVGVLLKHGADPRRKDGHGQTALHRAAYTNSAATARLLLAGGADVNARDEEQSTPLMVAAYMEQRAMIQTLLEHGADAKAKNRRGEDALAIAQRWIKNWMSGDDVVAIQQMLEKATKEKAE